MHVDGGVTTNVLIVPEAVLVSGTPLFPPSANPKVYIVMNGKLGADFEVVRASTLQIVSRYTALVPSYIWTEELARFCLVWSVMLGAMLAVREGTHFTVDVFPRLSPRGEAKVELLSGVSGVHTGGMTPVNLMRSPR